VRKRIWSECVTAYTSVAFSGDVEVPTLVLWELLEPPLQEHHVVRGFIGWFRRGAGERQKKVRRDHHHSPATCTAMLPGRTRKQSMHSS
jgi:hypothetical protein